MGADQVSAADLAGDFGLGFMRSRSLIDEFETEGLISGPDPDFIHNVRQPNGELVHPDEGPRDPLDVTVRRWVARLILRLRGKNV